MKTGCREHLRSSLHSASAAEKHLFKTDVRKAETDTRETARQTELETYLEGRNNTINMNGQLNGFHNSLIDEDCFLFTSESVGEGHPGMYLKLIYLKGVLILQGRAEGKHDRARDP